MPHSPARLPRLAARTLAAVALPSLLAGCAAAPAAPAPAERPVFGRPPTGATSPAAGATPLARSTAHPSATRVTPSISSRPCTPAAKGRLCFSASVVPAVIDPRKPCVDGDDGIYRAVPHLCVQGTWVALPDATERPAGTPTP